MRNPLRILIHAEFKKFGCIPLDATQVSFFFKSGLGLLILHKKFQHSRTVFAGTSKDCTRERPGEKKEKFY